jgi:hypothetical protein
VGDQPPGVDELAEVECGSYVVQSQAQARVEGFPTLWHGQSRADRTQAVDVHPGFLFDK